MPYCLHAAMMQCMETETKMNAPCNVTVIALGTDDDLNASRKIRIRNTGYGAQRHADRWIARGYKRVSVAVYSNSTGRTVELLTVTA